MSMRKDAYLPISHLIRHFLLFVFFMLFLHTFARAAYNLWQLDKVIEVNALIPSFLQGLRFDLALIGLLLIVPIILVPLLAMFRPLTSLARVVSVLWLFLSLVLVLLLELITPHFMAEQGVRPDMVAFSAIENPAMLATRVISDNLVPAVIGLLLFVLILVAFWVRLDSSRLLRYPVKPLPALCLIVVGVAFCVLAIRSSFDLNAPIMRPDAALISKSSIVNEISLNSTYKTLLSATAKR